MGVNAEDIKGRINYIEPTNVSFYTNGSKAIVQSNDLVMNPLEDYCIAVDLQVIIPNRKACSLAKENHEYIEMNFSSSNGTLSFFNGTDGVLTTNFTDINVMDPSTNTKECFGIESISIAYQAWLAPEVTIKFVDVRGGSVLLPEEQEYQDKKGFGSVYKALFTLPSPMFKLTVKGFYGKGATYYLVEESIDINLDSSSGNFEITAKFIGMMYRVYADIPMTYLCAAPYMAGGDEYWKNMVDKGVFKFKNRNNTETDMCTFPELTKRIADAAYSEERLSAAAKGEQMITNNDEKVASLLSIRDSYPLREWFAGSGGHYLFTAEDATKTGIVLKIENFVNLVSAYDASYNTNYMGKFSIFNGDVASKIKVFRFAIAGDEGEREIVKGSNPENTWFEGFIQDKDDVNKYLHGEANKNSDYSIMTMFFIQDDNPVAIDEFIYTEIERQILICEEEKEKSKEIFESMANAALEKALGFTPSIENVFNLAFAHMDTFMQVFYEHMDAIKDKIEKHDPSRMKSSFGATSTDIGVDEEQVPPYPAFYKDIRRKGETRREMVWPGDILNGNRMDEVNFVKNLLQATQLYTEEAAKMAEYAERLREKYNSGGTGMGGINNGNAPSIIIDKIVPLTVFDFVKKDKIENPYSWVKTQDIDGKISDGESFEDAVIGTFALRALQYMSVNKNKRKEALTFGKLEAANFVKAFGKDYFSDEFFDFINKYADDKRERRDSNTMFRKLTDETKGTIWNFGTKKLLGTDNKKTWFNLLDTTTNENLFPVGRNSFAEIQGDIAGNKPKGYYVQENKNIPSDDETFFYFNARDYISELYNGIERLETDEGYNLKPGEVKEFKNNLDSVYDKKDLVYADGCIYSMADEKVQGKDEKLSIFSISMGGWEAYFVKNPTMMDEKTKDSLFDEEIYTGQGNNILAKAYLFLSAMPIKRRTGSKYRNGNIPTSCENGIDLNAILLREGSFYWREKYMKLHGTDPIKTDFGTIKYEQAGADEMYMVNDGFWSWKNDGGPKETLCPINSSSILNRTYIKFIPPEGCTESRKRVLANEFEKWATTRFREMEPLLSNEKFYKDKKFKNGFDPNAYKNDGTKNGTDLVLLQMFLRETFFGVGTIFDYYAGRKESDKRFEADSNDIKTAFRGFMESLEKIYYDKVKAGREAMHQEILMRRVDDPFNNKDLRLSTYMTIKNLYDKWFVAPYKGRGTWAMSSDTSDFKTFSYIDSFYHDIGKDLNVNITKVGEWISNCMPSHNIETSEGIMGYIGKSLYEYLTEIAQNTGGMLIAFPQKIGGQTKDSLSDMFRALPFSSDWETDESSFVFIYTYKPSEHLGNDEYSDDGLDLETEEVKTLMSDDGYDIPAFGVTYAKQNQAYFKNITLNTSSPAVTEASITATMAIASKGAEGARETSLFGQDLYRVKTSYSYQCEFDMMGCVQVMPLMYFQLNNVPFWRGGYIIYGVTHQITAGDMTTHVVGQRLNKYSIPLTDSAMATAKSVDGEAGDGTGEENNVEPTYGDANPSANEEVTIPPVSDSSKKPVSQIKDSNITEEKPIIALTPAHGPQTGKGSEWFWSRKLIDVYIIPKLKTLKFYDGTSYADNIYRCNADDLDTYSETDEKVKKGNVKAKNTGGGYSMRETRDTLIGTYGSKRVISIVPHWNAGRGSYFWVFSGHEGQPHRKDSQEFAKIMREEARKLVERAKNNEFRVMPRGFMNNGVGDKALLPADKTDGAVDLNCACLLTENFFADYGGTYTEGKVDKIYANGPKKQNEGQQGYLDKDESGRFKCGEGWLLSDEGMTAISDMHVEAIRRYINNLHSKKKTDMTTVSYSKNSDSASDDIYTRCAAMIGCEVEALKAVIKVESNGSGFFAAGKPSILFEGHIFWKQLKEVGIDPTRVVRGNEDILYPEWTKKYYKGGLAEYDRLGRAKAINETAALKSASWGMLQIMGFNYKACGCNSVQEMVKLMSESSDNQILLGTKFICSNSEMKNALINKDWTAFAKKYNGPKYYENKYDERLEMEYIRLIS